jgi:hypothetical protein
MVGKAYPEAGGPGIGIAVEGNVLEGAKQLLPQARGKGKGILVGIEFYAAGRGFGVIGLLREHLPPDERCNIHTRQQALTEPAPPFVSLSQPPG